MLDSLPKFAELLLSNNAGMLPHITTSPLQAGNPRLIPQDPSTLGLALVGIGTLAVYLAASGWRRSRSAETRTTRPKVVSSIQRTAADPTETPKRGAA